MKVTMMLADAAQQVGGKLYILGGGWSQTPPGHPSAVALYFQVPWDQSDDEHKFKLELLTSDGDAVLDQEGNPIAIEGGIQTGRPPGLMKGTPLDASMAVSLPPLPLVPSRYEWRLTVGGQQHEDWRLPFNVIEPPAMPGFPVQ